MEDLPGIQGSIAEQGQGESSIPLGVPQGDNNKEAPTIRTRAERTYLHWEDVETALIPEKKASKLHHKDAKHNFRNAEEKVEISKENEKRPSRHQVLAFLPTNRDHTLHIGEGHEEALHPNENFRQGNENAVFNNPQLTEEQQKELAERDAISQAIANSNADPGGTPGAYSTVPGHSPARRTFAPTQSIINEASPVQMSILRPQNTRITPSAHLAVANMVSERSEENLPVAEAMEEDGGEKVNKRKKTPLYMKAFAGAVFLAVILGVVLLAVFANRHSGGSKGPNSSPTVTPGSPTRSPTESPSLSPEGYVLSLLPNPTHISVATFGSPQQRAFEFVSNDPSLGNYSDSQIRQRFALGAFYFASGGPAWTYDKDWLSYEVNECDWYLRNTFDPPSDSTDPSAYLPPCNAQREFEHLWQWASKMVGSLPPELFWMTSLKSLNLQTQTDLGGSLPSEIGLCTDLERLTVSDNAFTLLTSELGRLTALKSFELANSALSESIPTEFGNMQALESLDLSKNFLREQLPSELGQLKKLTSLSLSSNELSGYMPTEFGGMASLEDLQLYRNNITGPLQTELGQLGDLRSLLLFDNALTGTIPTELALLSKLQQLQIYGNDLTGTLPAAICELPLLSRPKVDCLKVACPSNCDCDCRDPYQAPKEIVGGTASMNDVPYFDDDDNATSTQTSNFTGGSGYSDSPPMPAPVFVDSLPLYTQESLQNTFSPQSKALNWLDFHPQYWELSDYRKTQLFALSCFYYSYDGDDWHDSDRLNWMSYTVSECEWSGNECNLWQDITKLSLAGQSELLKGTTPPEVSLLPFLGALDVFDMHLSNELNSVLPSQLSSLYNFTEAHLNSNRLTGTLPEYVGDFRQLTSLKLHTQTFTGTIPSELGLLENLRFLTLHNNFFTGDLPSELGLATALESLSVYATDITGTVPDEICALPALSNLQVSCLRVVCPEACSCTCNDEL